MNKSAILCLIGGLFVSLGISGGGCGTSAVIPGLLPGPPAIIPTNPDEITLLRTFRVDLRAYPQTYRINWEFGDGSVLVNLPVAEGRAVTHGFLKGGVFEVKVHLFDAPEPVLGRSSELIATGFLPVEVTAPNILPTAAFVVEDVFNDAGEPVTLTKRFRDSGSRDRDGAIKTFAWDFGDGSHDTGEIVEHTFARGATFVVRLTVADDRGGIGTTTRTVMANTAPVASFTATESPNNALAYTFDASASSDPEGAITTYRWDFGDGSAMETGRIASHTYTVPNDYTVVLTVTDEGGATASTSRVIDITGSEPFVRSISPAVGEVDETLSGVVVDGENFESGATVRLERGADTIEATSVTVVDASTIEMTLSLAGAEPGDYNVIVTNPDSVTADLREGFRVVTANLVRLNTSMGDILFELVDDAPVTTANFLQYVEDGFYDGTIFHRVVVDFVVQGGGFLPGMVAPEGLRDPIVNEFSQDRSNLRGTVAMAKLGSDPDSATSQFFVNLGDNSENLDNQNGGFTVFATVIEGMDVADAIAAVPLDGEVPVDDVVLVSARRE